MSSSGIHSINSGPLLIRSYNQNNDTLSTYNTYLLGQYDIPIPSNYILITTLNGQLAPTNSPIVSSMTVSTLNVKNGSICTINASSIYNNVIQTSTIIASTLQLSTFANFPYQTSTISLNNDLTMDNKDYLNKYIFVNSDQNNRKITISIQNFNTLVSGSFMTFKNININNYNIIIDKVDNIIYNIPSLSSITVMWDGYTTRWRGVSQF
jgi:hypothetical protein